MTIAEIIMGVRIDAGMTQRRFADAVGISQPTVSCIELGKFSPNLSILVLIARAFDVSVSKLVEGL
jgi:DNA-binding XRE family transcriptional regulator